MVTCGEEIFNWSEVLRGGSSPLVRYDAGSSRQPGAEYHIEEPDLGSRSDFEVHHEQAESSQQSRSKPIEGNSNLDLTASPANKKRPRSSLSGLPPPTGPDYTTSPSLHRATSREQLKPFQDDQLIRAKKPRHSMAADENVPRIEAEKAVRTEMRETLGDGGSQENSQETSQESLVVRVDKGKGRYVLK